MKTTSHKNFIVRIAHMTNWRLNTRTREDKETTSITKQKESEGRSAVSLQDEIRHKKKLKIEQQEIRLFGEIHHKFSSILKKSQCF